MAVARYWVGLGVGLLACASVAAKPSAPKAAPTISPSPSASIAPSAILIDEDGKAHPLNLGALPLTPSGEAHRLDVSYRIGIAGFTLASINFKAIFDRGHYVVASIIATKGIAAFFSESSVQALATGELLGKSLLPRTYNSDVGDGKKRQLVGLRFGEKGPLGVESQPPYDTRFPIPDEMKSSALDPLSGVASLMVGAAANPETPCATNVPVYDGRRRYDLRMSFDKMENLKSSGKGSYSGAALHCVAQYVRVAGFKPPKSGRKATVYPPVDVWLAPMDGGAIYVPVRMEMPSDFGSFILKPTQLSVSGPGKAG